MPFRIAIVNDLAMAREALRRVVATIPDTTVCWVAADGEEAVARARVDRADLVLMDLIMPVMDGVEATRLIMKGSPCPILVVTATVEGNATRVYEAIGAGALDAVDTPRLGADGTHGAKALVSKVEVIRLMAKAEAPRGATAIAPARPRPQVNPMVPAAGAPATEAAATAGAPIIAVGSSTGGPQALATFLKSLPNPLPYAVVIVQHMDVTFLPGLATWLSGQTGLNVELAPRHGRPTAGSVMVAGQDLQMVLKQNGTLDYVAGDPDLIHRPSVDVFFESLAKSRTQTGAAVMLTGMGRDGAAGMKAMRDAGWRTFAQDRETSIVWGMPGAAVQVGGAEQVLPLNQIGPAVHNALKQPRAATQR
jgi:two-component system response regulator WspF